MDRIGDLRTKAADARRRGYIAIAEAFEFAANFWAAKEAGVTLKEYEGRA
jgi:phosphopantetheinyl transferase (holo-ACP synthase)